MRRAHLTAAVVAAATLLAIPAAVTPAVVAAKPRLDRSFGPYHGHWERGGAAWGSIGRVLPARGGTALVIGDDGRVARIGTNGKPDAGWGRRGVLRVNDGYWPPSTMPAARWGDRFTFLSEYAQTLVVDGRGRRLPVGDALDAAVPPGVVSSSDELAPDPDGSLWHLRTVWQEAGSMRHIGADGQPLGPRVPLPGNGVLGDGGNGLNPLATRAGIVVVTYSEALRHVSLRRLRADGTLDPAFRTVPLGTHLSGLLPWRDGVVVVGATRVLWIDGHGRVARRSPLTRAVAVSFDGAGRLLVAGRTRDTLYVTVRRLRADGSRDRAFGTVKLAVPGDGAFPLGVVAAPGGRILVIGQVFEETEGEGREDTGLAVYRTVVWRLRTR